jgi:putative ABC transport system ATP-binding protein
MKLSAGRLELDRPSAAARGVAVTCCGVTKEFGADETKTMALRGIDLDVGYGQMTLLVGPSGCGKTTLISVIAGLLQATSGEVTVLDRPLQKTKGSELVHFRRDAIGFVFQQYNLLPKLTAVENAAIPLIIQGQPRKRALDQGLEMLAAVGLEQRAKSLPSQLSGGQQQRVAIARALVHGPRLLVCDEPTAALDAQSGRTVMELLQRVAVQVDRAVIVVTHDTRVFDFGDRIVQMSDGRIEEIRDVA